MDPIAIIGMSGRFPGAGNVEAFWKNLANGVESISRFTDAELEMKPPEDAGEAFVNARGVVQDADLFDAAFFNFNAREAELLDPQHRVFLECAWEALESAGYDVDRIPGLVGVWAGSGINSYLLYNIGTGTDFFARLVAGYQQGESAAQFSNDRDFLATRVSYKLNLKGPSLTVQTACSTSLVAIAQACQGLWSYQTDMALAGGVSISFPQRRGYVYQEGAIASADGHTRTFDAAAQGTVFSSGAGVVLLKRLEDALTDGDPIVALIRGAAINNDGAGKVSFTAPSVDGQAEVIQMAQALAGVEPGSISYVEAHGTGTPLGDPIEVAALTQAFRTGGAQGNHFCALGSLKTNVGHMDIASGVAALIKTALALRHRQLPPSLHFREGNPHIDFANSPFYVNTRLREWPGGQEGAPRRAGVSSFGVGGTNAHLVLEEAPRIETKGEEDGCEPQLFILSARSEKALEAATANLARCLRDTPELRAADVSYTLQMGRRVFGCRRVVVGRELSEVAEALERRDAKRVFTQTSARREPSVAFLFPGQGAQAVGMGESLYRTEAVFRGEIDRCAEMLQPFLDGVDLRTILYPSESEKAQAEAALDQTCFTQPALFVFGYALAKQMMAWGIRPSAMLGHSVGEYVAATLAGVFSLEDALRLVAQRARLVQAQPGGIMLAVRLPEAEVSALLTEAGTALSVAAVNASKLCVVSGTTEAVTAFEQTLEGKQVASRRLKTSHAFHSAMMDPVVEAFTALFESVVLHAPQLPFVSNLTGRWITDAQATDPHYWARHLREGVRFADGVGELLHAEAGSVLLEVGPGQTLAPLVRQHPAAGPGGAVVLSTLLEGREHREAALTALGRLWMEGVPVDWVGYQTGRSRRRVALPTYPFERKRYWIEPTAQEGVPVTDSEDEKKNDMPSEPDPTLPTRKGAIVGKIHGVLKNLSGQDQSGAALDVSFLELGFDSLLLTQVAQAFRKEFGVKVTFRQLLEDYATTETLATYLDAQLPREVLAPVIVKKAVPAPDARTAITHSALAERKPDSAVPLPTVAAGASTGATPESGVVERIIQEQLRVMAQQLETLRGHGGAVGLPSVDPLTPALPPLPGATDFSTPTLDLPKIEPKAFGPYRPIEKGAGGGFTAQQQRHLDALITRYNARTPGSKRQTQETRARLSDPRTVSSFRQYWKEAVYPVVVERSAGARLWDVDGNEYVDLTMGFGTNLLGHSPAFVTAALAEQLQRGIEVGPQTPLAGKVAALLCEMTGAERAAFTNTGSEAVLAAVRLARTVTGRTRIATTGGFHGINDEVLVRGLTVDGQRRGAAIAPGIPDHIVRDVLVIDYGTEEGLAVLRAHAHELACLLIEPVQSRKPGLQPREFLQAAREITAQAGCVLVFDEIITGFRCDIGGAQAFFDVRADLMTYGKIIGGGLPIGAVCGKAEYMDALDGGAWQYGDGSFPEVGVTFFAGTYIRHPLTMAASWAILNHLKREGGGLQKRLNERTAAMAGELNAFFAASGVPMRLDVFSSWFYPHFDDAIKYGGLLYFYLRDKGVHIWEGRPCFLSTAHTEADVDFIVKAFKESVREMQTGGFFPGDPLLETNVHGTNGHTEPSAARAAKTEPTIGSSVARCAPVGTQPMQFSLYYFGNYPAVYSPDKYRLILESAKYADEHGFTAVWLPERHFHSVGGFSPNSAVLAAALARGTSRIQLRGGSVVLPLHHPVRVAEEWAMVDNLSHGRVGISIASGWHPNDFIFAPERFERRREICLEDIQTIQKLWRGESLPMRAGTGSDFDVKLFPLPVQRQLPVWLTCIHEESFVRAGEAGAGVLGYLMNQTVDELAAKIDKYREALARNGHDASKGHVTILVHTYLGGDLQAAREKARGPLREYLRSYLDNSQKRLESQNGSVDIAQEDIEYLLDKSFEDYVQGKALIGTPESCVAVVDKLRQIGVDEIGCFIDFGVDPDAVLGGLCSINTLREHYAQPVATEQPLGLSESQQGLWVLGQTDADGLRAYNESTTLELRGPLDAAALGRALQRTVNAHDALRTTISQDGEAQTVHADMRVELPFVDLSDLSSTELPLQLAKRFEAHEQHRFDFEQGPVLNALLIRCSDDRHLLTLTFHHLLGNGPSYWVFLEDLAAFSIEEHGGTKAKLEPPLQSGDYFRWRATENVAQHTGDEQFWKEQFTGGIPVLELPSDHPRPARLTLQGGRCHLDVSRELTAVLRKTAAAQKGSLFMVLLSAFQVLMHRLSSQDDLVVGTSYEGEARSLPGGERLFANTTNVMPLRSQASEHTRFTDLFAATKDRVLKVNEHQNYFFGKLIKTLGLPHDASRSPVFAVFFNYESGKFQREFGDALNAELLIDDVPYRSPRDTAMFELYLNVAERDGALRCEFDFNTDLYDGETVSRWLHHYHTLLEAICAQPEASIWTLPLLDPSERAKILVEWNATDVGYPLETATLHGLIESQVQRTPERTALVFERQRLTYGELDRRANQLANTLLDRGVTVGARVGVCMERSVEMVVALLGVLKTGAAYVPFDPEYPAERLAYMMGDARVPVMLTQARLQVKLPSHDGTTVCLDSEWAQIAKSSETSPAVKVQPEQPAYVIYTSGSTGQPKGAVNSHLGICNRLLWMQDTYRLGPDDRVLQKTPFSFDVSVWEFFWPLLSGATLIMARPGGHQDGGYLAQTVLDHAITTMHFVPPMLAVFLEEKNLPQKCASLRRVICSGEALPFELQERFFGVFGDERVKLHNLYGPTEAAVDVTFWECQRAGAEQVVPIGRPVANTQIYLLDRRGQPVPIGVPGELHIGGSCVGLGYLGRPELTSEKFVADPFRAEPAGKHFMPTAKHGDKGAVLYKTGDLARWREDGAIIYLGRMDNQVKVRGFRIELGEIEAALNAHPDVRESVVTIREEVPGERRITAYLVREKADPSAVDSIGYWRTQWEALHHTTIEEAAGEQDPTNVFLQSIHVENSEEQWSEFTGQTVARVLARQPESIYEIGCGTGGLALLLQGHCSRYWASDFSASAVEYLRDKLRGATGELPLGVQLFQRPADDFSGIEPTSFDLVLLHSVAQYFPDAAYLTRVLEGAVRATRPGGCVYVGAVQSKALFQVYHAALQAQRAPANLSVAALRERLGKRLKLEDEFTMDPEFFYAIAGRIAGIGAVDVRLRRGRFHNKSTQFVYDVLLHVGEQPARVPVAEWQETTGLAGLRGVLERQRPETLGVRGLSNARLQTELKIWAGIAENQPGTMVGDLCKSIQRDASAVDPEHLWQLGKELSYHVHVSWSATGVPGSIDAVFTRREGVPEFALPKGFDPSQAPSLYASEPREQREGSAACAETLHGEAAASLRESLRARLPEYMIPAAFVSLGALPLSPNGKVDRRALPAPDYSSATSKAPDPQTPLTPLEQYLTGLWTAILDVERIGPHDNFFETGGDSLLGLRMVNRLRDSLGEHVSLVVVFEAPTIHALAKILESNYAQAVQNLCGLSTVSATTDATDRIGEAQVARMRQIIGLSRPPAAVTSAEKNPPAVFVLSPMRSGSTLLRIMLAGNPGLFSPPELQLLQFGTLAKRRAAFVGYEKYLQEGTIRALMQAHGIDLAAAQAMMAERENAGGDVQGFYRELQAAITPRLLVDKTPDYAMDLEILRRAEAMFAGARYIHLARHPLGMVRSYEQGRFLLESPYRGQHDFSARQMAELTWLISHRNIRQFLQDIPAERQRRVRFEDVLAAPESAMRTLGEFLGVGYDPGMIAPYADGRSRMTDGVHAQSAQVGDHNFQRHGALKAEVADQWRAEYQRDFLSPATWETARSFGYENPFQPALSADEKAPVPLASSASMFRALPSIVAVPREARRVKRSTLTSSE